MRWLYVFALSMAVPCLMQTCMAQTTAKESRDLAAYPLTMDHVTKQYQSLMDLSRLEKQDPGLKRDLQGWSRLPLERQIQFVRNQPEIGGYFEGSGDHASRPGDDADCVNGGYYCNSIDRRKEGSECDEQIGIRRGFARPCEVLSRARSADHQAGG